MNRKYLLYIAIIYHVRQRGCNSLAEMIPTPTDLPVKHGKTLWSPLIKLKCFIPFPFFWNFPGLPLLKGWGGRGGQGGGSCLVYLCLQTGCKSLLVPIHHKNIKESVSLRFLKLNLEYQSIENREKNKWIYEFFSFLKLYSKSAFCKSDITATVLL